VKPLSFGLPAALRLMALVCSIVALSAVPSRSVAQGADILTGRIIGTDGQPVVGARVVAMSIETEITRSVLTDRNGRYMINFPDGGGRYILRVSFLGLADAIKTVMRDGDEELLLTNITMAAQAIQLDALEVTANRPPPGRGQTGEQSTELTQDMLNRLPLPDLDPSTLALLAAGVVGTSLDSLSGRMGFSVAGMSDLLNQIVLDGMIMGEGGLQVPQEGIRRTQVTTSTFDASRGGFAGGQVSMTTARGNNRTTGSLSYQMDNSALQLSSAVTTNPFTRHNLGGSVGGPLVRNRLFYNVSFGVERNVNHRFALTGNDPLAAIRSGVAPDSIDRFLSVLSNTYGFPTDGTGPYNQLRDNYSWQTRLDWNMFQRQGQSQTLTVRFNGSLNDQDSTRINPLDLADHGGEQGNSSRLGQIMLSSRFGSNWTNNVNLSFNESWNEQIPFAEIPEGRVRVTSDFEDGTRGGGRDLVFGGNPSQSEGYRKNLQLSEDLSFLMPVGDQLHRLKVGGNIQKTRNIDRSTSNIFGSFTFNSLEDFENNRPERYERTLTERRTNSGTVNGGLYVGDTWRISQPLELTLGLRWDYARLLQKPDYNPAVEQAFGRRTDIEPAASGFSPRVGFNYRIASGVPGQPAKTVSGGIGWFAGQTPTNIFQQAYRQTGLPSAEQRLNCIGEATPIPDWELYLADPTSVPTACADGGPGVPPVFSSRSPNVTLIDPDQQMPSSLRGDIGYRTRLPFNLNANFRYTYSRGYGLWGYYDINLDEARSFMLAQENRPFFGDPQAIVTETGAASMVASRLFDEFGAVYDIRADRASTAHQLSAQVSGFLPKRITMSANYTLGFARDNGSGSFASTLTAGNPNIVEWATSNNDRRHTLNLTLGHAITTWAEVTAITRLSSGSPFTPRVDRDINGDGAANDRAFIFDPSISTDTAISYAIDRLLGRRPTPVPVPGRIASCLESQLGQIADRNSCRNPWSYSLSLRASLRPNLPQVQRRLTISVDASNVLIGLDELIHGSKNMKGWGEAQSSDGRLLQVRGFDPVNGFIYEVNEDFGQQRRGLSAQRNPFALRVSGRLALGGQAFQNNRGFGPPIALTTSTGGGPGGFGDGFGGGRGDGFGGGGGLGDLGPLLRANADANVDSLVALVLPNPTIAVLGMKDSLKLTEPQIEKVTALSVELQTQLEARRTTVARVAKELNLTTVAANLRAAQQQNGDNNDNSRAQNGGGGFGGRGGRGGGGGGFGGARGGLQGLDPQLLQRIQLEIAPVIEGARRESSQAMAQLQRELTPEQWQKIPARIRGQGGRGGGFNAVGMLDRMLANPIPVLLQLKDTLRLTPEQIAKIEQISTDLQAKLAKRREDLGRRFDNVQGEQQGRVFQEMQPQIQESRTEVTNALKAVEKVLTSEQWKQVPERVKNPFQGQQLPGQRQGRGRGG
jgi:carboxypeptidase family protein/TonB-dependent receptor-like protein/LTXXQ motif family protein